MKNSANFPKMNAIQIDENSGFLNFPTVFEKVGPTISKCYSSMRACAWDDIIPTLNPDTAAKWVRMLRFERESTTNAPLQSPNSHLLPQYFFCWIRYVMEEVRRNLSWKRQPYLFWFGLISTKRKQTMGSLKMTSFCRVRLLTGDEHAHPFCRCVHNPFNYHRFWPFLVFGFLLSIFDFKLPVTKLPIKTKNSGKKNFQFQDMGDQTSKIPSRIWVVQKNDQLCFYGIS